MGKLLLFLAAAGIGLVFLFDDWAFLAKDSDKEGRILAVDGIVMGLTPSADHFADLQVGSPLSHSAKIITGLNGTSLIEYGEIFKLQPQSSIQLLQAGPKYQVHLLDGELVRKDSSGRTEYFVDGVRSQETVIRSSSNTKQDGMRPEPGVSHVSAARLADPGFQEAIDNTLALHQRFVEKCFIKHYDRTEGQTVAGRVLFDFEVAKNGRLREVRVIESSYSDKIFQSCLVEVLSRVKLKGLDPKKVVKIQLPLVFTLPTGS